MTFARFRDKVSFRLRYGSNVSCALRRMWLRLQGARIGRSTNVPRLEISWPHQVSVGDHCILESDIFFKFDGVWQPGPSIVINDHSFIGRGCEFNIRQRIDVGRHCLIASGCKFIDHDHGVPDTSQLMGPAPGPEASIVIGENVWLGVNVVVLKGVTIGRGAVVAAGAVVTKSIPPFEIWAGVPARKIGARPAVSEPAILQNV